jgi:hypothetical protein
MRLRLWWWREVRKAPISKSDRDTFERFGEAVIGSVLAGGLQPRAPELQRLYGNAGPTLKDAADWLTERGDSKEQQEQRLETAEWAILTRFSLLWVSLWRAGNCSATFVASLEIKTSHFILRCHLESSRAILISCGEILTTLLPFIRNNGINRSCPAFPWRVPADVRRFYFKHPASGRALQ